MHVEEIFLLAQKKKLIMRAKGKKPFEEKKLKKLPRCHEQQRHTPSRREGKPLSAIPLAQYSTINTRLRML